uniref:Uncharacterized protein n=1 Tax=Glossina austeni TaxID=7395 RepID=A0A1A9UGG2_GLOAU
MKSMESEGSKPTTWEEYKIQLQQGKNTAKKMVQVHQTPLLCSLYNKCNNKRNKIEPKINGTTEKIEKVQETQRILQTHIGETYQQIESNVNVLEEKVDNAIGQVGARINAYEEDADAVKNEIKAL